MEQAMKRFAIPLVAASILMAVPGANAGTITNGSFETPVVPSGNFTSYSVGSASLTGWNVIGPSGTEVAIVSGSFSQNGVSFPAQDGNQWLDLTGNGSNSTEGVSQAVATTVGNRYQLSYYIGNTTGGGVFGTTSTVNVSLNGAPTFADTNSTVSPTTQNWEQFTHTFVAGTSTTTLAFQNGDPSTDNDNGLDNVVLTDLGPAATPEPATLTLVGVIIVGLTGYGWRRRKSAAV
jgi:hypothetical protein